MAYVKKWLRYTSGRLDRFHCYSIKFTVFTLFLPSIVGIVTCILGMRTRAKKGKTLVIYTPAGEHRFVLLMSPTYITFLYLVAHKTSDPTKASRYVIILSGS